MKEKIYFFLFLIICSNLVFKNNIYPNKLPSWTKKITKNKSVPGRYLKIKPVKLKYIAAWNGTLKSGSFELSITEVNSNHITGVGKGRSSGIVRPLWPYNATAKMIVKKSNIDSITTNVYEMKRKKVAYYNTTFTHEKQSVIIRDISKKDKNTSISKKDFFLNNNRCALSASFFIGSNPLKNGDELTILTTPIDRPYLIKLKVLRREKRKIKRKTFNTIVLDLKVQKVNPNLSLKNYKKVRRVTAWISDDQYRLPLEIQSKTIFGFVSVKLNDVIWLKDK